MTNVEVIDDPAAATVALEPVRSRLLAELALPASAATRLTSFRRERWGRLQPIRAAPRIGFPPTI